MFQSCCRWTRNPPISSLKDHTFPVYSTQAIWWDDLEKMKTTSLGIKSFNKISNHDCDVVSEQSDTNQRSSETTTYSFHCHSWYSNGHPPDGETVHPIARLIL